MIVWDIFRQFIFSNRAEALVRRIAWLSVISITVSVTAFLVVLFVMNGMNESIISRILALEPHLLIHNKDKSKNFMLENHPVMKWLEERHELTRFMFENQEVILRTLDGQFRGGIARGLVNESLDHLNQQIHRLEKTKAGKGGSFYWDPAEIPGQGEIAIGYDLARSLGVFEGDYLTVISPEGLLLPPGEVPKFEKVLVKKVVTTSLADWDTQFIFYQRGKSLESLKKSLSRKIGIEVYLENGHDVSFLKQQLEQFSDLDVETWEERNSAMFFALKMEKFFIGLFLGLAGLIAGSSILTVLTLLLSEKRADIAILRTLGLSARRTVSLFTQVGALLSASGIVIGVILGTSVGLYLQINPLDVLPEIYYDSQIPAKVEWSLVLLVIVLGAVLAGLGSYWPAREASLTHPSDALRIK